MDKRQNEMCLDLEAAADSGNHKAYTTAFAAAEALAVPVASLQAAKESWKLRTAPVAMRLRGTATAEPFVAAEFDSARAQVCSRHKC